MALFKDVTPYKDGLEHLLEELKWVEALVHLEIQRFRKSGSDDNSNEFKGLLITEEEVNSLLKKDPINDLESQKILNYIEGLKRQIANRTQATLTQKIYLPLYRLTYLFHLDPFEKDVLLIALAPELDLKYERLYAYLQDDVTKRRPTVDLGLNLLCPSFEARLSFRKYFDTKSNLFKNSILSLGDDPKGEIPLLARSLKIDERIISFLLGSNEIDSRLIPFSSLLEPKVSFEQLILEEDFKNQLKTLCQRQKDIENLILFFQGPYGSGRKFTALAICKESGKRLLVINLENLFHTNLPLENAFRLIFREALLQDAVPYFDKFSLLLTGDEKGISLRNSLLYEINRFSGSVFLGSDSSWEPVGLHQDKRFITFEFSTPSFSLRKRLWQVNLDGRYRGDIDIDALSNKFKFTGGEIRDAIKTSENLSLMKSPENLQISMKDFYVGCKLQSNKNLSTFSRKTNPKYRWEDIILPEDKIEQLKEICSYVKYKNVVYLDWGFDKKLSLGKGLNILFSGPSGTGKTMAAEIITNELSLELYKIDLSCVVSKYIGETEKNLSKIFKEAETSNAILFFDEADALFGKRSEVKDSHDRYANIEIAYLLQKMEEYEGMVILATNLQKNIDEAFTRRMHFIVEFPFPDEKYRYRIWQSIFPNEAPKSDDIDFDFLAKNFKIAGGNIKNIILTSAFLSAEDSEVIIMKHIINGTKREFQKMGRLCVQSDFGKYYELISGGAK